MNQKLKIGWAKRDITPTGPTMLLGQMGNRLATLVATPLTVTALALESNQGEQCVMVSADLCLVNGALLEACRQRIAGLGAGIDPAKCFINATHTHTAPQFGTIVPLAECFKAYSRSTAKGNCGIDVEEMRRQHPGFVDSEQYMALLIDQISEAVLEAWTSRKVGSVAWGFGTAAIGDCRRLAFRDRGTVMYGKSWDDDMWNVEGHTDHSVNLFFTYNADHHLTGMIVNVACPAQTCEALSVISADYWHYFREAVVTEYGQHVFVMPQCGAAGDQSPHKLLNQAAELRMLKLKGYSNHPVKSWNWADRIYDSEYNVGKCREIASRLITAVKDVFPFASKEIHNEVEFRHTTSILELEPRLITLQEADDAREKANELENHFRKEETYSGTVPWLRDVVTRYENPQQDYPMEFHAIRIGDIAFATNEFELYLDFGDRIKGRSPAMQTFLVQLCGNGGYLSATRSDRGGSYGSVPASILVSAAGGQQLVESTLVALKQMFT